MWQKSPSADLLSTPISHLIWQTEHESLVSGSPYVEKITEIIWDCEMLESHPPRRVLPIRTELNSQRCKRQPNTDQNQKQGRKSEEKKKEKLGKWYWTIPPNTDAAVSVKLKAGSCFKIIYLLDPDPLLLCTYISMCISEKQVVGYHPWECCILVVAFYILLLLVEDIILIV